MKKRVKKLTLTRETLVQLESRDLVAAPGAGTAGMPGCWSGRRTCDSCELTCTTNYC